MAGAGGGYQDISFLIFVLSLCCPHRALKN